MCICAPLAILQKLSVLAAVSAIQLTAESRRSEFAGTTLCRAEQMHRLPQVEVECVGAGFRIVGLPNQFRLRILECAGQLDLLANAKEQRPRIGRKRAAPDACATESNPARRLRPRPPCQRGLPSPEPGHRRHLRARFREGTDGLRDLAGRDVFSFAAKVSPTRSTK